MDIVSNVKALVDMAASETQDQAQQFFAAIERVMGEPRWHPNPQLVAEVAQEARFLLYWLGTLETCQRFQAGIEEDPGNVRDLFIALGKEVPSALGIATDYGAGFLGAYGAVRTNAVRAGVLSEDECRL